MTKKWVFCMQSPDGFRIISHSALNFIAKGGAGGSHVASGISGAEATSAGGPQGRPAQDPESLRTSMIPAWMDRRQR